ncbi:ABC transporter permease [Pseudoduganella namucuonensis]|uniref:ABC-type transport system, involved in lipoprotein release, permease component n=1 Tax=Pseudoduganella namucuonensis TaxID=1035707 RepID=A0A1I7FKC5_9BURK|nr:ABC transporter permease [Pseudoduganella namucuonensis]SFU36640.1 ABC-type transport system, involved in lipoprotein release, permease component [Pseudoduganella namucuonensis]
MMWLKLSARSVLRQRRRSLLACSGIALGLVALLGAWSMFDGVNAQLIRNMTANYSGHLQIQRQGFLDKHSIDFAFRAEDVEPALRQPEIVARSSRLSGTGLLASGNNARGVLVAGVEPEREAEVTLLSRKLVEGGYLKTGGDSGMVVGASLARALSVAVGAEVAIVSQGMHGAIGAQRFRIVGIYDSGNAMVDSSQVFVTLPAAQELFSAPGRVTAVAMKLASLQDTERVRAKAGAALSGSDYRAWGWRQLLPSVAQSVDLHESVVRVVMLVLFGIVAVGMTSTLQMAVAERVREFGVMRAIGTEPGQLFRAIVYEGLLMASAAFAVGSTAMLALVAWLSRTGVDFSAHSQGMQMMQGASTIIVPELHGARVLEAGMGLLAVTLLATVMPAMRAARIAPISALRGQWRDAGASRSQPTARRISRLPMNLRLALRNLNRSRVRTALGLAALSFGLGAFIFVGAFAEGFLSQMVRNATGLLTGEAQIQHKSFRFDARPELAFQAAPQWLERLRELPQVRALSPRVQTQATLGSARKAEPITLAGVDPAQERGVTFLDQAIRQGSALRSGQDVLIGRKLAERLDVRVGEKVVVTAQDAKGQLASEAFVVAGIFDTGSRGPDASMAFVGLSSAQKMLALDERITNLLLRLHPSADVPAFVRSLDGMLPADGALQALTWQQLLPEVAQFSNLVRHGLLLVLAIVFGMVSVIVMNTLLMSVFERRTEFGTLLAIGADAKSVLRLVITEASLLAAIGAATGIVLGGAIAWRLSVTGVTLAARGSDSLPGVTDIVHPVLSAGLLFGPAGLLCLLVLAASVYPAMRTVKLNPVDALRRG